MVKPLCLTIDNSSANAHPAATKLQYREVIREGKSKVEIFR